MCKRNVTLLKNQEKIIGKNEIKIWIIFYLLYFNLSNYFLLNILFILCYIIYAIFIL